MALKIVNTRKQRLTDEDFRMLALIEEHPEVAKWNIPAIPAFGGNVEKAFATFKESIERISETEDEFLVAKQNRTVVGFVGIHRIKGKIGEMAHVGEVGISVHPDFQRLGIGTKLMKTCVSLARRRKFKRLEANTLAHNIAMTRVLEKAGFQLEGIRRKRVKINGKYYDEFYYAILILK